MRHTGERWLVREEGSYLPRLYEKVVEVVKGIVITYKTALMLKAKVSFTDVYNVKRKAGEEWLVTNVEAELHILDVNEELVQKRYNTTLTQ